jgi:hypothetical protein
MQVVDGSLMEHTVKHIYLGMFFIVSAMLAAFIDWFTSDGLDNWRDWVTLGWYITHLWGITGLCLLGYGTWRRRRGRAPNSAGRCG